MSIRRLVDPFNWMNQMDLTPILFTTLQDKHTPYKMKVFALAFALVGLASAAPSAIATVEYEQWWDPGCQGRALLGGTLAQGYCVRTENFPGQSVKLTVTSPCPEGTSPQVTVSSSDDCDNGPIDWTFGATGECIDVAIQPISFHLNCV
ncbi:hypothetical protein V8C44DRAFT_332728 [Trichoderma aethiopicum]